MKRICVFCGSSPGGRPEYGAAAEEMAAELVRRKIGLVYGGGNVGLMGIIADSVRKSRVEAQGVIPEHLMAREVGHKGLTKLHVVGSMHERKALMADLCVHVTTSQNSSSVPNPPGRATKASDLHAKPCGMLNVLGFYSPLLRMFDHAVEERFLKTENRALVLARDKPADLLQALEDWRPLHVEKWLSRETR